MRWNLRYSEFFFKYKQCLLQNTLKEFDKHKKTEDLYFINKKLIEKFKIIKLIVSKKGIELYILKKIIKRHVINVLNYCPVN